MVRKSTQVAMGGVTSALCLLLMFMTGLIPFATFALPATAGILLVAIVVENGYQTALLVYGAVSFLSLVIVPDREAALMFIAFFGHYPILKSRLERIPSRLAEGVVKFSVFNLCVVGGYWVAIKILGMGFLLESMGEFGKYSLIVLLAMGNLFFVLYDRALTNIITFYVKVFRVRYLSKL